MNPEGLIPIIGGIIVILYANGTFPKNPKDPQKLEAWRKKFWPIIRILGPLVIIFGLLQICGVL